MDDLPAKKTGIKSGDILVKIEDEPVNTVQELNQKIQKAGATTVTLELLRRGDTVMVEVTPAEDDSHLELTTANLSGFEYFVYPKSVWASGRPQQNPDSMKYFEFSTTLEKLVEEVAQLREAIENKE
jgi:C-terminal processing protease CtpA/Prc